MTAGPLGPLVEGVGQAVSEVGTAVGAAGMAAGTALGGVGGAVTAIAPAPVLEPGSSTSEVKVIIGAIIAVLGMFGITLGADVTNAITVAAPICVSLLAALYAAFRTWRKNSHAQAVASVAAVTTQRAA